MNKTEQNTVKEALDTLNENKQQQKAFSISNTHHSGSFFLIFFGTTETKPSNNCISQANSFHGGLNKLGAKYY